MTAVFFVENNSHSLVYCKDTGCKDVTLESLNNEEIEFLRL